MERYILTVSLNAAVDISYAIDDFAPAKINIVSHLQRVAGGKANNCARVLAGALGQRVVATGFAGGTAGRFIQEDLRARGIHADYEETDGENRSCFAIIDRKSGTVSEIREQGPTLTPSDCDRLLWRFRRLAAGASFVILAGSLPPGVPAEFYATLVKAARESGEARTIVDASGAALRHALMARPFLVKPNRDELEQWAGRKLKAQAEVLDAARALRESGPEVVIVSLGGKGALLVSGAGVWQAVPPRVAVNNTVGSGDSLVAGLAAGLARGLAPDEAFRLGVACGTANALTRGVAEVDGADVERLLPLVRLSTRL
jgi:tagatose 6-phosphate kinase